MAPITVNGTELVSEEWHNTVFIPYIINLMDLPHRFNGYRVGFSITEALYCKKGSLVTAQHNDILDGVA